MKLQGKQIGILIALVLGAIMIFLPAQDNSKYKFDPAALGQSIAESEDHIQPQTLSEWIIEGRGDFMLIDIRTPEEFEKSSIKSAVNIPLVELLKRETLDELPSQDKLIVIYSNGNSHAAQAWLVMKSAGIDAYMLEGGLNYWSAAILNPQPPAGEFSDDEFLRYKAAKAVGNYFGGGSTSNPEGEIAEPKKKKKIFRPKKKKKKLKGC